MSDYTPSLTDEQREAVLDWMELPTKPQVYEAVARCLPRCEPRNARRPHRSRKSSTPLRPHSLAGMRARTSPPGSGSRERSRDREYPRRSATGRPGIRPATCRPNAAGGDNWRPSARRVRAGARTSRPTGSRATPQWKPQRGLWRTRM